MRAGWPRHHHRTWRQTPGARTTRLLRPRTSPLGPPRLACAHRAVHARTPSAPCRIAPAAAHGFPPCNHHRAPAPSRPPHPGPRLVTIAKRPLWRAGWRSLYVKTELL